MVMVTMARFVLIHAVTRCTRKLFIPTTGVSTLQEVQGTRQPSSCFNTSCTSSSATTFNKFDPLGRGILSTHFHSAAFINGLSIQNELKCLMQTKWHSSSVPIRKFCAGTGNSNRVYGVGVGNTIKNINSDNCNQQRGFSFSLQHASRSNKSPFHTPQAYIGTSRDRELNKKKIGIADANRSKGCRYFKDNKLLLKDTRLKIGRRFRHIRSHLLAQNKRVHETLSDQREKKDVLVQRLRRKLATTKRENIKTVPNLLTALRMASAPLLSYLVLQDQFGVALSIFVLAGLTDMLDGYIARNFKNQRTAFGTALDPLADKFLISFLTISLTMNGLIPVPVTVLILGRDAGLVTASFYIRYDSLAPPRTLARYFDFSHVTAKLYPSNISKINTAFQLSYVACTLAAPVFDFVHSPWLQLLMYTTAATTFMSGADYMFTWRRRLKIIKNN